MKRISFLSALISGFLLFGAQSAYALNDFCDVLVPPAGTGLCQITLVHNPATGSFTYDRNVEITGTGALVTGAGGITMTITSGDFTMDSGALIDGNVAACATGGPITITLQNGDIDLQTGSIIRSNSCSGGAIVLTTDAAHTADIDGLVESVGSISGTGGQPPGGGTITIIAGCTLTVSDTGRVSSRGADPGADLVHLEGCEVIINGLVESTGAGHVNPNNPANHCNLEPAAHPPPPLGPSTFYTGCVEIWSGTTVIIDSTNGHKGEVHADIGIRGGSGGRGWVDIYANGNISILDGAGNNHTYNYGGGCTFASTFAVHSNGGLCQNTDDGGLITIKSLGGDVAASGNAIQADAISAGSKGGEIHVEAFNNVSFNAGTLFARGQISGAAAAAHGGFLGTLAAPIRAFNGALSWTTGTGDVRPVGNGVPAGKQGQINLEACGLITLGASFPVNGAAIPPFPATSAGCGGAPVKDTAGSLPTATCFATFCGGTQSKSGMKFLDVAGDHLKDVGDPPLANWVIKAFDSVTNALVGQDVTDALGNYNIPLPAPGTYNVCEVQQAGFTQTCPQAGAPGLDCNGNPHATINDCSTIPGGGVSGVGYFITMVALQDQRGNDFGNTTPVCPEDPKSVPTITVKPNLPQAGNNYQTVQAAYDAAVNGDVIGMFGNTKENVTLGDAKTLKITQCTSARITAADNALPVWNITSTGKLTIVGPDSVGGTIGWLIANPSGGPHTLKSVRANGASIWGIRINSNGNEVSWNDVSGNGGPGGILVVGNSNKLKGGTVGPNNNDGVKITGDGNSLSGATVESNTGNGVVVSGNNNQIKSNKANLNGTGLVGDGFQNAAGTGNNYSGNSSNTGGKENHGAEYRFVTAGVNGGSNRADGTNVPSAGKCPDFAQANTVCE